MRDKNWVLGLVAAAGLLTALPSRTPASPQEGLAPSEQKKVDPASADSLDQKLQMMRQRHADGVASAQRYDVTEEEANAYLLYRLSAQFPAEVTEPWVRFSEDRIQGGAMLDMKLLQAYLGDSMLSSYLEGQVPLEVLAKVRGEGGVGQVEFESVTLAGIPIPQTLIDRLLSDASKSPTLPEGVRLGDAFPLPYSLTSARVRTGKLILRQGGTARDAQAQLGSPTQ